MGRKLGGLAVLLAVLLAGCAGDAGTVSVEGSTAMADVVMALREAFLEGEPVAAVNYTGTGSGAGVQAALSGGCDIGLSSRPLTAGEEAAGAVSQVLALDGIAVVAHPSNPVEGLSMEELAGIFSGQVVRWSEVGGEDRPIAVYGREAGSGTRDAFEAALGAAGRCAYRNEYSSTGDVVGGVAVNPNAIGYVSLSAVGEAVSVLRVDGAACTCEAVREGRYPLQRPFLLVTRRGAPLSPAARSFLDFARSEEAAAYLALAGAVPPEGGEGGAAP